MRFLLDYTNLALAELQSADTSDVAATADKVRMWKNREQIFQAIQSQVANAIDAKDKWMEDAKTRNLPPLHPEFASLEEQYAGTNDPTADR